MIASEALFVTGMQRSGTTLLEKLLGQHPDVSMLSQPFPHVFVDTKAVFLRARGYTERYPLGPLIDEDRYELAEFTEFLASYRLDAAALRVLFEQMADYSGQLTKFSDKRLEQVLSDIPDSSFAELARTLWRNLSEQPGARIFGAKEIMCEEYLPYLLANGVYAVVIIRDPRDCLTSLNYGRGREFGGRVKPTLFNLRHWRKSVAYALRFEETPGFTWLRYEDLVDNPQRELDQLADQLRLPPFDSRWFEDGIRDHRGNLWRGNSSHDSRFGIDPSSVGGYRRLLPPEVVAYTEAICYLEMQMLGYTGDLAEADAADAIRSFREPYDVLRDGLVGYTDAPANIETELARLAAVRGAPDPRRFLFPEVQRRLREAIEA